MPPYSKNKLEVLLKAINLADYDNVKSLDISLTDLMFMRKEILDLHKTIKSQNKKIKELKADNENLIGQMINLPKPATNIGYYVDKIS